MFETLNVLDILHPELLVLIPACWGIGLVVKSIQSIKNKYIPLILFIFSLLITILYILGAKPDGNIFSIIFTIITQGVGYWAVAWVTYAKFIKNGTKLSITPSQIEQQKIATGDSKEDSDEDM